MRATLIVMAVKLRSTYHAPLFSSAAVALGGGGSHAHVRSKAHWCANVGVVGLLSFRFDLAACIRLCDHIASRPPWSGSARRTSAWSAAVRKSCAGPGIEARGNRRPSSLARAKHSPARRPRSRVLRSGCPPWASATEGLPRRDADAWFSGGSGEGRRAAQRLGEEAPERKSANAIAECPFPPCPTLSLHLQSGLPLKTPGGGSHGRNDASVLLIARPGEQQECHRRERESLLLGVRFVGVDWHGRCDRARSRFESEFRKGARQRSGFIGRLSPRSS